MGHFHDFSDPDDLFRELRESLQQAYEGGSKQDFEDAMDVVALSLMHMGIDNAVYDITVPYNAAMHAYGEKEMADSLDKVTMRIGARVLGVAYSVLKAKCPWPNIEVLPDATKSHMHDSLMNVLQAMGATVQRVGNTVQITGWDCDNPNHNHPIHATPEEPISMDIDKAVDDFRKELDKELGDADNPVSRWMRPKEEDK